MEHDSQELLVRYQRGDMAASEAIFARYTSRLLSLARSRLSAKLARRIDADDIVQSTYRSFFVRARDGEFVADASGDLWRLLASITLHKLSRQARRQRAAKRSFEREATGLSAAADPVANLVDREPSAADVVAATEELHWLMAQFEPIQRRALQLRLREFSAEEIAGQIGRSERTVRRWLVEARELLAARSARQQSTDGEAAPHSRFATAVGASVAAPLLHADYRLDALIGSGGMSKVYAATEKRSRRKVAIKVLRKRLLSRPHLVERFLREAEIVARFDHPNIVRIRGLGRMPDGNYFMEMDFIDGRDLDSVCRSAPLKAREAARIVASVADAVQHAHERGIIHRDLKPGNVILRRDGTAFVADFGFAWFDGSTDRDESIVGTAGFMAPEQIDPRLGSIGPTTDVYGLGAVLFMLCSGRPPHGGSTVSEVVARAEQQEEDESIATEIHRTMPAELGRICERCMARDWRRRFAAAADVAVALRAFAVSGRPTVGRNNR